MKNCPHYEKISGKFEPQLQKVKNEHPQTYKMRTEPRAETRQKRSLNPLPWIQARLAQSQTSRYIPVLLTGAVLLLILVVV